MGQSRTLFVANGSGEKSRQVQDYQSDAQQSVRRTYILSGRAFCNVFGQGE